MRITEVFRLPQGQDCPIEIARLIVKYCQQVQPITDVAEVVNLQHPLPARRVDRQTVQLEYFTDFRLAALDGGSQVSTQFGNKRANLFRTDRIIEFGRILHCLTKLCRNLPRLRAVSFAIKRSEQIQVKRLDSIRGRR